MSRFCHALWYIMSRVMVGRGFLEVICLESYFAIFNLLTIIVTVCAAVSAFCNVRKYRVLGIIFASMDLVLYALNFQMGQARWFDAMSANYALVMLGVMYFAAAAKE